MKRCWPARKNFRMIPTGEGWLLVLRPSDPSELDSLMTAEAYGAKVNAG